MSQRFQRIATKFDTACLIVPTLFEDYRGYFKECYRKNDFAALGIHDEFVQDNLSWSTRHVLRGMHYDFEVAKLVQVVHGRTYHVIVDLRAGSPTFKQWQSFILSEHNHRLIYVPKGFANGFLVLSDAALVSYKQSNYWNKETSHTLLWNDPSVNIGWPVKHPLLSEQDGGDLRVS